jgi:hypothetical protein
LCGSPSISTDELAASWAPELDLVGTVALAPGAMFDKSYSDLDEVIARVISVMMLYGAATEHPELIPTDYVGPQTAAAADAVLPTGCLNDIAAAFAVIPADTYWLHDPRVTEPARSIMLGNVASPSPLLVAQGTVDTTVDPRRTRDLLARLCTTGQSTEYTEYEGADHGNIGTAAAPQIVPWIAGRFAAAAPTNSCAKTENPTIPPDRSAAYDISYFGGSDRAYAVPRSIQARRSSSSANPSTPTYTMPLLGRPVKSISRACGSASASANRSLPTRTINSSPTIPTAMLPRHMNAMPPNILRSVTSSSPSTARMRSASPSSYATSQRLRLR